MEPQIFGPFVLLRKIATGGTAEIYLARRPGDDGFARHLALKRILPHLTEEAGFIQLLRDEARLAAHLHHAHIVQVHDVGEVDGQVYIAMEYVRGTDLGRLISAAKRRTRRVVLLHPDAAQREAIGGALTGRLRAEIVGVSDADGVRAQAAEGCVDLLLAPADTPELEGLVTELELRHPELMRVLVLGGETPTLGRLRRARHVPAPNPNAVAEAARRVCRVALPLELAVQVMTAMASGLDHAHTAPDFDGNPLDIVHRDINPSNVLVGLDGTIKLTDFGIARAANRVDQNTRGNLVGTYAYMSPEQATGKEPDHRSDLFSASTVFAELLSGEHPYAGDNQFATLRAVQEDGPAGLDGIDGVPAEIVDMVRKAAQKAPTDRPEAARGILDVLDAVARREGFSHNPVRMARYLEVVYDEAERRALGVSTTGYNLPTPAPESIEAAHRVVAMSATPAPGEAPRRREADTTPTPETPPEGGASPAEVEVDVDLDDLDVPGTDVGRTHPVEAGDEVEDDGGAAPARRSDAGLTGLLVGVVVVLMIAAGAYWRWRSGQ